MGAELTERIFTIQIMSYDKKINTDVFIEKLNKFLEKQKNNTIGDFAFEIDEI